MPHNTKKGKQNTGLVKKDLAPTNSHYTDSIDVKRRLHIGPIEDTFDGFLTKKKPKKKGKKAKPSY